MGGHAHRVASGAHADTVAAPRGDGAGHWPRSCCHVPPLWSHSGSPLGHCPLDQDVPLHSRTGERAQAPRLGSAASTRTTGRLARLRITCSQEDPCYTGSGPPARPHPDRPGLGDCPVSLQHAPGLCSRCSADSPPFPLQPHRRPRLPDSAAARGAGVRDQGLGAGTSGAPSRRSRRIWGTLACTVSASSSRGHTRPSVGRDGVHTDLPSSAPPAWHPHSDRDKPGQGSSFVG